MGFRHLAFALLAALAAPLAAEVPSARIQPMEPREPARVVGTVPEAVLQPECIKPAAPTLTRSKATVALNEPFTLTWSADPWVTCYYRVGWSSDGVNYYWLGNPTYSLAMNVTVTDSTLAGHTLYFFVRATNTDTYCPLETDSNVVSVAVSGGGSGCVGPPTPSLSVNPSTVSVGQSFTFTWSADPYATTEYWWLGVSTSSGGTYNLVATYPGSQTSASVTAAAANAGQTLYFRVWAYPYGGSTCESLKTYSNPVTVSVTSGGGGGGAACTTDTYTLCLMNGRFKVQATYRDYGGNTGSGKAVAVSSDTGYFWFFASTNVEVMAKIVSFCSGSSGNYGLYASGLTDVQVTFKVTDTSRGVYREYTNPLGNRFCTIADGFATCP